MTIIPQQGFLFAGTLKENIDPQNKHTEDQLENIIARSRLKIKRWENVPIDNASSEDLAEQIDERDDTLIKGRRKSIALENCIDMKYLISNAGSNLSNGEKQIINYYRILLRNQDIICLDEATSNIDSSTNELLLSSLFEISKGKTLISITHKLESIEKFDRIIVFENGEIVQDGSFEQLIKHKNSKFNELYSKQF